MKFDWKSYIQLSEKLLSWSEISLEEARLRTALSRCYYGVFCIARNKLIAKGINIPKVDTHKFVREKYQTSPDTTEKKIAKNLRRLWNDRIEADYENEANINLQRAKVAIELAKRTLKELQKLNRG